MKKILKIKKKKNREQLPTIKYHAPSIHHTSANVTKENSTSIL